jgi:4-amino-4-deoxy-L-arabinose transferase-like glycosyltransferase
VTDEVMEADVDKAPRAGFGVGLALLVAASLVWGTAYTLVTKGDDDVFVDEGDAFYYSMTAAAAARGLGFVEPFTGAPAAEHAPLTTAVLVPSSWLVDDVTVPLAQRLTIVVLGALGVGAVGLAGREVGGDAVGLAAAATALVNPNLWINHALVMSETPFVLLFALLLLFAFRLARAPSVAVAAVTGGLCGLLALTRAEAVGYLAVMVVPVVLTRHGLTWGRRAGAAAAACLSFLVVLTPWMVWVNAQFEEPVLISTNGGLTLAGANCQPTYYTDEVGLWSIDCALALTSTDRDASENSRVLQDAARDYVADNLDRVPLVVLAREGRMLGVWNPDQVVGNGVNEGRPRGVSWAALIVFWVLLPVSVLGAVELRRRRVTLIPVLATVGLTVVSTALFWGIPRLRVPVDVVMCVLVGVAVVAWSGRRESAGAPVGRVAGSGSSPSGTPAGG